MMNNGQFLIPANSKKSMLIFGLFNYFDFILFGIGCFITLILLMLLPLNSTAMAVLAITPALITGFLVFPIPNYHNTFTFLRSLFRFFSVRQRFIWKGWCFCNEELKK